MASIVIAQHGTPSLSGRGRAAVGRIRIPRPSLWLSYGLSLALIGVALAAPLIAPHSATEGRLLYQFQSPSWSHIFGTDEVGRDILSRVIYGFRYSLLIALLVEAFSVPVGIVLG